MAMPLLDLLQDHSSPLDCLERGVARQISMVPSLLDFFSSVGTRARPDDICPPNFKSPEQPLVRDTPLPVPFLCWTRLRTGLTPLSTCDKRSGLLPAPLPLLHRLNHLQI